MYRYKLYRKVFFKNKYNSPSRKEVIVAEVQHVQRQEIMQQQPLHSELQPWKIAQIFCSSKVVECLQV